MLVFGHTRLAIIDLDKSANQPMSDISGRYFIVYNGEVYNFKEIKKGTFQVMEWFFKTHPDTEVILESYKIWDKKCLDFFEGMLAFAIWRQRIKETILARDRLGEKPTILLRI